MNRGRLFCAALLVSCAVHSVPGVAQTVVDPVRVTSVYMSPLDQAIAATTQRASSPTIPGGSRYYTRQVPISAASAGRLARGAMGGPLGMAITATMLLQGWEWDDQAQDFLAPGAIYDPSEYPYLYQFRHRQSNCSPGICCQLFTALTPEQICPNSAQALSSCAGYPNDLSWTGIVVDGNTSNPRCVMSQTFPTQNPGFNVQMNRIGNQGQMDTLPSPVPPAQVGANVPLPLLTQIADWAVQNPGALDVADAWPELADSLDELADAEDAVDAGTPSQGQEQLVGSGSQSEPVATDWPLFCSWATVVCDFIDWFRQPPDYPDHPPIPIIYPDAPDLLESSLPSTADCPQPILLPLSVFGDHEMSWQPVCDAAATVRPVILAGSYLISALILIGQLRR